ncbi:MAG: ATP-dependent sacrificial sulfur transferase LarE [Thermodesulfobacteriota bacterium]|nr:ATP-dependent sacrificial sulfur transferase LarE [Thermodesulfobacteriota bacterium]
MKAKIKEKLDKLETILTGLDSVLVAFSGGVDSSLLLCVAARVLPGRATAVTAKSVLTPPGEMETAAAIASDLGVERLVLDFEPLKLEHVKDNSKNRCYYCKAALARLFKSKARILGLTHVLEGSHAGDSLAHRPGARAVAEAGLKSPLMEAGLNKTEVRTLARTLGLPNWNRPALACLATRFPYDKPLTIKALHQVFEAESYLAEEGFDRVRARHHGSILRLEFPPETMPRLNNERLRRDLAAKLAGLGFDFVTVDLAGYRSGVFDSTPRRGG